mgnify:CR=1 FL=1
MHELIRQYVTKKRETALPALADGNDTESNLFARCLLYTSDAADERSSVDLGGRRIIKKKNTAMKRGTRNNQTKTIQTSDKEETSKT